MRNFIKKIVQNLLKVLSKAILAKYHPDVIGITGSFGKTSTKEAIYAVLSQKFNVRRNIKNYNNEIGLPLTIIGCSSGESSVWGWCVVILKVLLLLTWKDKDYPEILVLEMAVDHPSDMKYLVELAPCKIGVVANVGPVHIEFFGTVEKIAKEKSGIITHIDKNGWAILNVDNKLVSEMAELVKCRVLKYGIKGDDCQVCAREIAVSQHNNLGDNLPDVAGLSFKLSYDGSTVPVLLPNILGEHLIYAALAAAAIGIIYEMNLVDISKSLGSFKAPKGRMNIIAGIKDTTIIDDTYNAGPDATEAALKVLSKLEVGEGVKRYAVLGDMLELGDLTEKAHRQIGRTVADNGIDILITVGERARDIAKEAVKKGMDEESVFSFSNTSRAGRFLQDRIDQGDFVLVKGSQGMRMEKIVKEIMANPLQAKGLLVRQEENWLSS